RFQIRRISLRQNRHDYIQRYSLRKFKVSTATKKRGCFFMVPDTMKTRIVISREIPANTVCFFKMESVFIEKN
ncbi:hypothetical protein, partial [Neobacillus novalis]|uniref:hypothetical protein n=1 Tax=Neobacillus novalis TaxID=220687 RepID=UPI001C3F2E21